MEINSATASVDHQGGGGGGGDGVSSMRVLSLVFSVSAVLVLVSVCVYVPNQRMDVFSIGSKFSPADCNNSEFRPVVQTLQTKLNSSSSSSAFAVLGHSSRAVSSASDYLKPPLNRTNPHRPTVISKYEKLEQGLARARAAIRKAGGHKNRTTFFSNPAVYRNPGAFYQSYIEMEKRFKVYVYEEGDPPMVHRGPCKNLYTSEGRFIREMEHGRNRFKINDPDKAHVYFLPFSVAWMVEYLYNPSSHDGFRPMQHMVADYIRVISTKHPFWNRTQGADHFMLSCHDWGPYISKGIPFLFNSSIRVLCNANSSEGFNPQKDATLPEIYLYDGNIPHKLVQPPPANNSRPLLGFFAGGNHGPVRPILLQHWKDRDKDLRVYQYLPKGLDYYSFMLKSKFCLCPSGYEVASPRLVEGIYAECVPVIIAQNYVLPFSDVLKWEEFSIQVDISDIPRLKEILMAVPEDKYLRLKEGTRAVRKHFVFNEQAQRFDIFHMILHSVWLRRINVRLHN